MAAPKLWSGRFSQETDALVHRFNASLHIDRRLWPYDIQGSIAHVLMLGAQGIIPLEEAQEIGRGLKSLADDLDSGSAVLDPGAEDVHMAVESLLKDRIGPVAGKLHTARSRNDQVATDIRLFLRDAVDGLIEKINGVQELLIHLAEKNSGAYLPGTTHLQHAQPVRLSHHLLAYFWMLARDAERLKDARKRINVLPLGSGALAGTAFPIDRHLIAAELGFDSVSENSLDAVADRDFAVETVAAIALILAHLSRFSEELILWSAPEFGYVEMGDNVTTGSSIMPQKKNPDVAELIRGKTGRVFGDLTALLTIIKGLPLAYNKDLQEDKEPLFDAVDTASLCLEVLGTLLSNTLFKSERMAASLRGDFSTATDLADYLVRQGLPFREAHEVVGKIVGSCTKSGTTLEDLEESDLMAASPLFAGASVAQLISPSGSADARESYGGTGKLAVKAQIGTAKAWLAGMRESAALREPAEI